MKAFNKALITTSLILGSAVLSFGAPPSGEKHMPVSDYYNTLWDLSKVPSLAEQNPWVEDGETAVEARYHIVPSQNGSGKLMGSGTTTVETTIYSEEGIIQVPPFQGVYKFSGSIASSKGLVKISWASSVSGMANLEGSRKLSISDSDSLIVNAATMKANGRYSAKASAAGLGSVSSSETYTDDPVPDDARQALRDGSWTLTMNLTPDSTGKKITGTATVLNIQDTAWNFTIKGTYTDKGNLSKLTLTPDAAGKGSSLQVTMVGDNIQSIKGKISGQTISIID